MEQLIGQVLHKRYRIQSLLGQQKGRRTFLASDLETGSSVVVKLLFFAPDFTWDDLKLFEREAEVLKSLAHPRIPRYLDYFEVETELGKGFVLVQTYIEAKSLQDLVLSGYTLSEEDLKAIAKQILELLDYLHNRQPPIVHRDIKPSNILLGDRSGNSPGRVYLVDFGSVQTAIHQGTRTIVGTYGYMPPEQFGGNSTPASDLYAVGATLIYLATGEHPDQLPQQDMRIIFENRVNLNPNLINWLKLLTQPSVDRRLKSAKEALVALERLNLPQQVSLQQGTLSRVDKPFGSKVKLTSNHEMLEVLLPPRGFHPSLIFTIGFAIAWNSFLVMWYGIAFASWNSGGWFAALFAIGHLGAGIFLIWGILFTLFGTVRLAITPSKIHLQHRIFGFRCFPSQTAVREHISKIECTSVSYKKDSDGDRVRVPPEINIWVGTKKFSLGGGDVLTEPELDWLAWELGSWLNLPVTKNG